MTSGKVRWGIIGPGRIAHSFARDITAVDNAELVAVAARDGERARAFADLLQRSRVKFEYPLVEPCQNQLE